jgi:hypothetical protein
MKKKASALTIILSLLLITSTINLCMGVVDGVTVPHFNPDPLTTSMDSLNGSKVYAPNLDITLNFTVCRDIGASASYVLYPISGWFMYSIDDNQNMTATPSIISRDISTVTSHHGGPTQHETTRYSVKIDLHTLSEGWHKIAGYIGVTVFLGENQLFGALLDYRTFDPLFFVVGGLPSIKVASLENTTYYTANIPLSFVTEHVSQINYSVDGRDNVTIAGNTTLTGLPNGDHNLTVYAIDEIGNVGASETVFFSVEVPFPTTLAIACIVSVAVIGVGLFVYFKKRKR